MPPEPRARQLPDLLLYAMMFLVCSALLSLLGGTNAVHFRTSSRSLIATRQDDGASASTTVCPPYDGLATVLAYSTPAVQGNCECTSRILIVRIPMSRVTYGERNCCFVVTTLPFAQVGA